MILQIYQERTDDLDRYIIAKEFAQANSDNFILINKKNLDHIKIYLHAIMNLIKGIKIKSFSVYYPNISLAVQKRTLNSKQYFLASQDFPQKLDLSRGICGFEVNLFTRTKFSDFWYMLI